MSGECFYDEDSAMDRFRCVLGDRCLVADPFHFPSECFSVEDAEAYYAEMERLGEDGRVTA